jgi:hypothetical protein
MAIAACVLSLYVIAGTSCSYNVSFNDCEVTCAGSSACPDGLTCIQDVCRLDGNAGACAPPGSMTLRETVDDKVDVNLKFACTNTDSTTADGSWYRVFSLADAGVTTVFHVTQVTFGISTAIGTPSPHVQVKLSTYAGGFSDTHLDTTKLTALKMVDVVVPPTQITELVQAPIVADAPGNSLLVAEIITSNLNGTGDQVNIGSTDSSETHPAYLRAPFCGTSAPTTTTAAGLVGAAFVITVTGSH